MRRKAKTIPLAVTSFRLPLDVKAFLKTKAMEQQRKLLELRFKLSGAGEPEQQPLGVVILPPEED